MAILVATFFQFRLCTEICEHLGVFHLCHANDRAAYAGQHGRAHFAQRACHVVELMAVFQTVPAIRTFWQKVVVAFALVVTSVEQVFLVVEAYRIDGVSLLC